MVNLSRHVIMQAVGQCPNLIVLNLTTHPETLAKRLFDRGRKDVAQQVARLTRQAPKLPDSPNIITVSNDGALDDTVSDSVAQIFSALQRARG